MLLDCKKCRGITSIIGTVSHKTEITSHSNFFWGWGERIYHFLTIWHVIFFTSIFTEIWLPVFWPACASGQDHSSSTQRRVKSPTAQCPLATSQSNSSIWNPFTKGNWKTADQKISNTTVFQPVWKEQFCSISLSWLWHHKEIVLRH